MHCKTLEFKTLCKCKRQTFFKLVDLIRSYAIERSCRIWRNQGQLLMTRNTFGIAKVQLALLFKRHGTEKITPELIKFLTAKADVKKSSCRFLKQFGFPQVTECLNGTQVP